MVIDKKQKLLLHICCGPCATWAAESLMIDYEVVLFFYNPNIWPRIEWEKRLESAKKMASAYQLSLIIDDSGAKDWLTMAERLAAEPEGGQRCYACYGRRLSQTAQRANQENCVYFATSLTVSPYKNKEIINKIGLSISKTTIANYLETDFQQKGGYQRSIELSKQYGLYRQKYCGCQFSRQ